MKYASDKPRNDKDAVFYAVKNYCYALEFASDNQEMKIVLLNVGNNSDTY